MKGFLSMYSYKGTFASDVAWSAQGTRQAHRTPGKSWILRIIIIPCPNPWRPRLSRLQLLPEATPAYSE